MSQPFYKLQATGNDFIFFLAPELKIKLTPQTIQELCARQTGVGADGLVVLHDDGLGFRWDFYNADGGEAEMCGNAARCATHLLETRQGIKNAIVKTRAGEFRGERAADGNIEVVFDIPVAQTRELKNIFGGRFPVAYFTNTGVPHCVIPVEKPWALRSRAKELAPFIFDKEFGKAGSNLTFVDFSKRDGLETVTLERGVNDFTLSCGTGVIAAAKVFADLREQGGWRLMKTPGGELWVFYLPNTRSVHLKGPASLVFKGVL